MEGEKCKSKAQVDFISFYTGMIKYHSQRDLEKARLVCAYKFRGDNIPWHDSGRKARWLEQMVGPHILNCRLEAERQRVAWEWQSSLNSESPPRQ